MFTYICVIALPPHTTHALQPLDKWVFGPLNRAYNDACSQFLQENPWNQVNKRSFPGLVPQAWEKSVTPSNILSGFRSCGIYPLNKEVLPNSVFGPSEPTDFPFNPLPVSPNQSQSVIEEPSTANVCSLNTANELLTAFPLPLDTQDLIPLQSDDDTTTTTPVVDTTASNIIDISDPSLLQLLSEEAITIDPLTDKCGNDVVIPIDFELSSVTPSPSFPGNVLSFTDTTEYEIKSMFIPKVQPKKVSSLPSKRKSITYLRLLTSEDLVREKLQLAEIKEEKEKKQANEKNTQNCQKKRRQRKGRLIHEIMNCT